MSFAGWMAIGNAEGARLGNKRNEMIRLAILNETKCQRIAQRGVSVSVINFMRLI
jgi:hypothetical protein